MFWPLCHLWCHFTNFEKYQNRTVYCKPKRSEVYYRILSTNMISWQCWFSNFNSLFCVCKSIIFNVTFSLEENNRGNGNDPCDRVFGRLGHYTALSWDFGLRHSLLWNVAPKYYSPGSYGPGPLHIVWAKCGFTLSNNLSKTIGGTPVAFLWVKDIDMFYCTVK